MLYSHYIGSHNFDLIIEKAGTGLENKMVCSPHFKTKIKSNLYFVMLPVFRQYSSVEPRP